MVEIIVGDVVSITQKLELLLFVRLLPSIAQMVKLYEPIFTGVKSHQYEPMFIVSLISSISSISNIWMVTLSRPARSSISAVMFTASPYSTVAGTVRLVMVGAIVSLIQKLPLTELETVFPSRVQIVKEYCPITEQENSR